MAAGHVRHIRNAPLRLSGVVRVVATLRPLATAITTPDSEISKDGGAFADCTAEATDIGTTGCWTLDLTAAECTCDTLLFNLKHGDAGAEFVTREIYFEPCLDSGVAQASDPSTIKLRAGNTLSNDQSNGCLVELVSGTGAPAVRVGVDMVAGTEVLVVDRAWPVADPDTTTVYIIHPRQVPGLTDATGGIYAHSDIKTAGGSTGATATLIAAGLRAMGLSSISTTVVSGASTSGFVSGLSSSTDNFYRYRVVLFLTGDLQGQTAPITGYTGSTKTVALLSGAITTAPANGDEIAVLGFFL